MSVVEELMGFLLECEKLKGVERCSRPPGLERRENSAEHSWSAVLAAAVMVPELAPEVDQLRVMKMLAVHDVVEIDAGDTFLYGDQSGKEERERAAAERMFGLLPEGVGEELHALWDEFEAAESEEAKFANAIDRILPMLLNYAGEGRSWKEYEVSYEQVMERNARIEEGSEELWEYARGMIESAREKGWLR